MKQKKKSKKSQKYDDDNEKNSISIRDDVEEKVDILEKLIKEDKNVKYQKIRVIEIKEE